MPQMSPMSWLFLELIILSLGVLAHSSLYFEEVFSGDALSTKSAELKWEW